MSAFSNHQDPARRSFDGAVATLRESQREILVFAIGSLMHNPEPGMVPAFPALAPGLTKAFAVEDTVYRGTPRRPGRTLGVASAPGAVCPGLVYSLDPIREAQALERLFVREAAAAYVPEVRDVRDPVSGRAARALVFSVDPFSAGFKREPIARTATVIAAARGAAGTNREYFERVLQAERRLGLGISPHLVELSLEFARAAQDPQAAGLQGRSPRRGSGEL